MGEFDKINKKENADHVGDPNNIKLKDAPATVIIQHQKSLPGNKLTGIGCTEMIDATPTYNKADCEYEITYKNLNCGIVLGRDRPKDRLSGYGGAAVKRSSSIDLVAGRMGPDAASVNSKNEILYVDNNFTMDSSRIHISQRTNIDQNFRIKSSRNKPSKNCAGIGIKSDSVRIIGRRDVRIVTGTDYYDSKGRDIGTDISVPCKISLVGDNRDDLIQPMVKGENLQNCLMDMMDLMHNILSTVDSFILQQNQINWAVINHKHRDKINVNSFGFPSEDVIFQGFQPALKIVSETKASLLELGAKIEAVKAKFIFMPQDDLFNRDTCILSNYNFCN